MKQGKLRGRHMAISLKTRLFAGFTLLMLLFSGLQIYSLMNLERANQEFQIVNRFHLKVALQSFSLETSQSSLLLLLKSLTTQKNAARAKRPALLKRWIKITMEKRDDAYKRLRKLITNKWKLLRESDKRFMNQKVLPLLRSVQDSITEMNSKFAPVLLDKKSFSVTDARLISRREHLIMTRVRRVSSIIRNRVRRFAQQLEDNERRILRQQILLLVGAIILGIIVIILAARPLRYLKGLTKGARDFGSGDRSMRIPVTSEDELGVLAREFNTMADAIEERESRLIQSERLAAAGKLAAQIAHEIRNPLAAISFNVELLSESITEITCEDPAYSESVEIISQLQREVDRLTEITEEYLAFSRLPTPRLKRSNINAFLTDVIDFIEGELLLDSVSLHTSFAPEPPPVMMDEALMRQVILNLVRNAKEAMPDGGIIRLRSAVTDSHVEVSVADGGPGIPEELREQVYEAFFTTKEHGTGLGMAVCNQIIQDHSGFMSINAGDGSDSGATGAVVTLSLPIAAREQSDG